MTTIQVVGLNHVKTPVEIRERVAFPQDQAPVFLSELRAGPGVDEALLLSTCNRVEAYMAGQAEEGAARAVGLIARRGGIPPEQLRPYVYQFRDEQAVSHLFRVASSLDSMVVGETQILSQVKEAYRIAKEAGVTGRFMNQLFQKAFNVAKAVHTRTRISDGKVSVSSVGVELASKVFRDLADRRVLVLGAGETGELTARCFLDRGVRNMSIANRGAERGEAVAARLGALRVPLENLAEALPAADIVVACAAVERPLITVDMLQDAMEKRGGRPMFVLDIGVPRNVANEADVIPDLYVFNIDDLRGVVDRNMAARRAKMEQGASLVAEEAREYFAILLGPRP
ncbi:MAG: glutamyl-tRNA reductase [Planctomycetes bacterium]|nr:glutamyl-tRNA reductase [Planctomycetota bacterium]